MKNKTKGHKHPPGEALRFAAADNPLAQRLMSEESIVWHHVLHLRKLWNVYSETDVLREAPGMVIPLWNREYHQTLHNACPPVVPINRHLARQALKLYAPSHHPLEALDSMAFAIEGAARSSKAKVDGVERTIAFLAVETMLRQREYIREGMVAPDQSIVIDLHIARQTDFTLLQAA